MNHIPPLSRPEDLPPMRTPADLEERWRMLMGPLGFGQRSLWIHLVDQTGRSTAVLFQVENLPSRPDEVFADRFRDIMRHFVPAEVPGWSVAFLLTRPGRRGVTPEERLWVRTLQDAGREAGLVMWPVHCANDDELRSCAPDDLAAAG